LLAAGVHNITAVYSGDANFNPGSSSIASISVAALAPAFTLTPSISSIIVSQGDNSIVTLTLAGNAAFSGPIAVTSSGAPQNGNCAINPGTVTLTPGGSAVVSLFIGTTVQASVAAPPSPSNWPQERLAVFAGALCVFSLQRRKNACRRF